MSDTRLSRADFLVLIIVLALAGIAVSGYLTWQWYEKTKATWCDVGDYFSCSAVGASAYAHIGPLPTAALGLGGFVVLTALAAMDLRGVERLWRWSPARWLFGFAIVGALIGTGLTVIEVFVIQKICLLCVVGFALDLGILGLAFLVARRD